MFRPAHVTLLRSLLLGASFVAAFTGGLRAIADAEAAEPFYVSLDYRVESSAEGCWDESALRRSIAAAAGYDPFRSSAPTSVEVRVGGAANQLDGHVEWRNANGAGMGERHFVARDGNCSKLLTEMSFAIGLQIELLRPKAKTAGAASAAGNDDSSPSPAGSSSSSPAGSAAAAAKTAPAASSSAEHSPASTDGAPEDSAERERAAAWRLWLGAGPSLALGLAPSPTGQARFFFGARRGYLSAELGLEGALPVTESQAEGSGFRTNLLGASAAVCGHRGALAACLVGKGSQLRVSGIGVDQPQSPGAFVAQAGLRLAGNWEPAAAWLLTPHIDALGLLTPRVVTLNHLEVWDMPFLSGLIGIDLAVRFR